MLEGINVLNETVIEPTYILWTILIILGLGVIAFGIWLIIEEGVEMLGYSITFLIMAVIMVLIGIGEMIEDPYKEYQVTIDDNVNFQEFNKRYNIIDQEGQILTINIKPQEE